MNILEAILTRHQERAAARGRRSRSRYADVAAEHSRTWGARHGQVPLDEYRLSSVNDEYFVAERGKTPVLVIEEVDRTLRHGLPNEAVYEGLEVRDDVDLLDSMVYDILLRDAPQDVEEPLERHVYSVAELEDDSCTIEEYIEALEYDSEEV